MACLNPTMSVAAAEHLRLICGAARLQRVTDPIKRYARDDPGAAGKTLFQRFQRRIARSQPEGVSIMMEDDVDEVRVVERNGRPLECRLV